MRQETLDRLSILGHHQMNFQPIKIALLTGNIPAKLLLGVYLGTANPPIVTDSNGQAIDHVDSLCIKDFPYLS
jgi:hypothetical protein